MALKRVAKLNGYHSPTVGRKYKSGYWLSREKVDTEIYPEMILTFLIGI